MNATPLWTFACTCQRILYLWTREETSTAAIASASAEARGWIPGEFGMLYCSVLCRTISEGEWIARAPRRRKVWREMYPTHKIAPSKFAEVFIDWNGT